MKKLVLIDGNSIMNRAFYGIMGSKALTTKDGKYTYEVEESFIVDPEQVEVLENADYEKITLITCTIGSKRRVIVTGKLIEKNEA